MGLEHNSGSSFRIKKEAASLGQESVWRLGGPSVCSFGERKVQNIWICSYTYVGSILIEHNHPKTTAELSSCLLSMQGPSGLQLSLTTILDFSSPSLCCKALFRAVKHSLEPVQSFCQQQQQPVLSALGGGLARGQGCNALSSAPSYSVWSEFKVGQNAFAAVNMNFLLFFL